MNLNKLSIPDRNGAPMTISAILNYKIVDAAASVYAVENLYLFV